MADVDQIASSRAKVMSIQWCASEWSREKAAAARLCWFCIGPRLPRSDFALQTPIGCLFACLRLVCALVRAIWRWERQLETKVLLLFCCWEGVEVLLWIWMKENDGEWSIRVKGGEGVLSCGRSSWSLARLRATVVDCAPPRLILSAVICLSQRLSHACLSSNSLKGETANGSLQQLLYTWSWYPTWITVVILELIHAPKLRIFDERIY